MTFEAALARAVPSAIVYRKRFVAASELFSGGPKFEGVGAEVLNEKTLLAAADAALTLSYVPPRGISNTMISKDASLSLAPAGNGSTLLVDTLPRTTALGDILFGLEQVLTLCRTLDPS